MSAWSADARFAASSDVLVSGEGEERYLTDVGSGAVFQVNETAGLIFESARDGKPIAGIEDALAATYPDVPREELARDLRASLAEFVERGLLRPA
jgi:hypothetical protein